MLKSHFNAVIYNNLPLTQNYQIEILESILTESQAKKLENGQNVRLRPKQQILMSINIFFNF